jgi:TPR repeat protein
MAPPGTVFYASAIQYPLTRAIEYFKMADSIVRQNIQEDEMTETDSLVLADINNKIGDMYGAQELVEKSVGYFKRSLMYFPGNAAVRKKYINFLINFYEYKAAKDQLDTLYIQDCIDFDDMYTKTDGEILSGNFKLAGELITRLEKMPVLKQLSVIELKAKLQVLSNNLTAALSLYKEYLSYYTEDSIIMYNIARIYALKGQQTEAFQWLKKAMDAGFNYIYVLYYDKAWKKYSKLPQWTQLLQNYNARTYSEQE